MSDIKKDPDGTFRWIANCGDESLGFNTMKDAAESLGRHMIYCRICMADA